MSLALVLVSIAGAFLIGLGLLAFAHPKTAVRFLLGFAATAWKHYLELALRLLVGAAFVMAAPRMAGSVAAEVAGWVLLVTTSVMVFVPWRTHRAFSQRAVPKALAHLPLVGLASLLGGAAVVWSVYAASSA